VRASPEAPRAAAQQQAELRVILANWRACAVRCAGFLLRIGRQLARVLHVRYATYSGQCATYNVRHNNNIRIMCRVTRHHTRKHHDHISTEELEAKLGIHDIRHYAHSRVLRYLGHVFRMDADRTPSLLQRSWVVVRHSVVDAKQPSSSGKIKALAAFFCRMAPAAQQPNFYPTWVGGIEIFRIPPFSTYCPFPFLL
jgi:hypothetical protein